MTVIKNRYISRHRKTCYELIQMLLIQTRNTYNIEFKNNKLSYILLELKFLIITSFLTV